MCSSIHSPASLSTHSALSLNPQFPELAPHAFTCLFYIFRVPPLIGDPCAAPSVCSPFLWSFMQQREDAGMWMCVGGVEKEGAELRRTCYISMDLYWAKYAERPGKGRNAAGQEIFGPGRCWVLGFSLTAALSQEATASSSSSSPSSLP